MIELLRWRALCQCDQRAYTFLVDGETEEARLTYGELDRKSRAIGAWLQSFGMTGERVLLLYPPGLDFITAFFGSLYAGAIAVPALPPRLGRHLPRLQAMMQDAKITVALTSAPMQAYIERLLTDKLKGMKLRWLPTDDIPPAAADQWRDPAMDGSGPALIQYTSGSTGIPKGVFLTHENLLHNSALIWRFFEHSSESRGVSWLPPYHDMGLIGGIVQPLYGGFPVTLLPPLAFMQRPVRWLQAITRTRATTSGGPNFAFDFCVDKITEEQREGLDLTSWSVAFCGSEKIRPETLQRFAQAFRGCGFKTEAFYPCYGLAEATLIVSGGKKGAEPVLHSIVEDAFAPDPGMEALSEKAAIRTWVGCGQSSSDQKVLIVDPENRVPCPPGQIGEIWVSGPSVAKGYWRKPKETARIFGGYLAGSREGPFLRTGDLGLIWGGHLFVAGRLKDLIIIAGRNHYPEDIEATAGGSHPALKKDAGAAFSLEAEGKERLVIVQETDRRFQKKDIAAVIRAVRSAVAEEHHLQVDAIVLIKPGSLCKTSSGKIQRSACRTAFLSGALEILAHSGRIYGLSQREEKDGIRQTTDETGIIQARRDDFRMPRRHSDQ